MRQPRPLLFWLSVTWTALVWSVLAWQAYQFSGLFRWLAEWQIEQWGQYRTNLTLLVVGFTLSGPALHWLGTNERFRQKQEAMAGDPAAKTVRARSFSCWMTLIAAGIALFAVFRLQQFPSPTASPVEIDLATLGTAEPVLGKATLIGIVDTQSAITTTYTSRYYQRHIAYFPVRPRNLTNGPARFWVDRSLMSYSPQKQAPLHIFLEDRVQGALVRNGLPGQARVAIEKTGTTLPETHYLLTTSSDGGREPYIVAALIGTVVAVLFLFAALLQTRMITRIRLHPVSFRPLEGRPDF